MPTINLPSQMASFAGGQRKVVVDASDLAEAFNELDKVAPMVRSQIAEPSGQVRPFVGLFIDDEQVLDLRSHPLTPTSQVQVVMSIAGG